MFLVRRYVRKMVIFVAVDVQFELWCARYVIINFVLRKNIVIVVAVAAVVVKMQCKKY